MSERRRVVFVDDEKANTDTFRRVFRRDFDIAVANSGPEGLDLLKVRDCDLLIADYSMPGMNGIELIHQARIIQPDIAVVILTAYADLAPVKSAQEAGLVVSIVSKPWTKETLGRWINVAMSLRSMRVGAK